MPRIVCDSCGREVYTTWPIESLLPDERRCMSCGADLRPDRRSTERRLTNRRTNPPADPGPPGGVERRVGERRADGRRKSRARRNNWDGPGWVD